jgi:hypothetical protein
MQRQRTSHIWTVGNYYRVRDDAPDFWGEFRGKSLKCVDACNSFRGGVSFTFELDDHGGEATLLQPEKVFVRDERIIGRLE